MPEPLTLIDARMPATVERWLDAWLTGTPSTMEHLVLHRIDVGLTREGVLITRSYWGTDFMSHPDRAALVAYVVAWARDV